MNERLIRPDEYTSEIIACIAELEYRMVSSDIKYTADDILVSEYDGKVYVLANPVLGEEPLYDDFGHIEKIIPARNLTIIYQENAGLKITRVGDKIIAAFPLPKLRVLRPDLCIRLEPS